LAIVKPIALKMFNLKGKDTDRYFNEVEEKLIRRNRLFTRVRKQSIHFKGSQKIPYLSFPKYYPRLDNGSKTLAMDWMEGIHLSEYTAQEHSQNARNNFGTNSLGFLHVSNSRFEKSSG